MLELLASAYFTTTALMAAALIGFSLWDARDAIAATLGMQDAVRTRPSRARVVAPRRTKIRPLAVRPLRAPERAAA